MITPRHVMLLTVRDEKGRVFGLVRYLQGVRDGGVAQVDVWAWGRGIE